MRVRVRMRASGYIINSGVCIMCAMRAARAGWRSAGVSWLRLWLRLRTGDADADARRARSVTVMAAAAAACCGRTAACGARPGDALRGGRRAKGRRQKPERKGRRRASAATTRKRDIARGARRARVWVGGGGRRTEYDEGGPRGEEERDVLRAEGRGRAVAREVYERREGREEDDGEERPAGARGRSFGLARGRRGARQCRREAEEAVRTRDGGHGRRGRTA